MEYVDEAFILIPEGIEIPALGSTSEISIREHVAFVKLFCPYGVYTCFILEYNPKSRVAFALVTLNGEDWEFGSVSIAEMESITLFNGMVLAMERDLYFEPTSLADIEELKEFLED